MICVFPFSQGRRLDSTFCHILMREQGNQKASGHKFLLSLLLLLLIQLGLLIFVLKCKLNYMFIHSLAFSPFLCCVCGRKCWSRRARVPSTCLKLTQLHKIRGGTFYSTSLDRTERIPIFVLFSYRLFC